MNKPTLLRTTDGLCKSAIALGMAIVLGVWAFSSHAAQTSSPFLVTVNQPGSPILDEGLCRFIGSFGTSVTVACSPGLRFISLPPATDNLLDTEVRYTGAGTVTSWRMIRFENGDYLEMTVRW